MSEQAAAAESALVARLKRGDGVAFDEVYDRYRPRLYSFLVRLTGAPALAEDLHQETWLRLAKSAPTLADDTRLGAWLFTVARNLFISHRRWAVLDLGRLSELRLLQQARGADRPSPFEWATANETERRLEQAIAALPLRYREVVLLVVLEGLAPTEAAWVLDLEPAAVRRRLARARDKLAASLAVNRSEPVPRPV